MNGSQWLKDTLLAEKKPFPILSFPCVSLLDITVGELVKSSDLQAKGMKLVADMVSSAASVSMMDLSVEAEAFGAQVRFSDDEVPTITGALLSSLEDAEALSVPAVGAGRTGQYLQAIHKACALITDRPVFAGVIGPFSLAGRLMDVTEAMCNCYADPDFVHCTLEKATEFLISYMNAYKETGAAGVVMAEPLAGLLSPEMEEEFSEPYVRKIVEQVQTDTFPVIYHNCGNNVPLMTESLVRTGAAAFHFGNAVSMKEMLEKMPKDILVMGNIDPAGQFAQGTPESIRTETRKLLEECCPNHPNFLISSGCDIPPSASWDNIQAFFQEVQDYYKK